METLSFSRMEMLEGGAYKHWVAGALCGAGFLGTAVLLSNPLTFTAGVYAASFASGSAIGTCLGLLSIN